jgi:hypothetical protein
MMTSPLRIFLDIKSVVKCVNEEVSAEEVSYSE